MWSISALINTVVKVLPAFINVNLELLSKTTNAMYLSFFLVCFSAVMILTFQAWSCVYNGPLSIFIVENRIADFTSLRYVYIELLLPVRSSTRVHLFSTYIWNWAIYETSEKSAKKYRSVSLYLIWRYVFIWTSVIENDRSCYFLTLGLWIAWTKSAMT